MTSRRCERGLEQRKFSQSRPSFFFKSCIFQVQQVHFWYHRRFALVRILNAVVHLDPQGSLKVEAHVAAAVVVVDIGP